MEKESMNTLEAGIRSLDSLRANAVRGVLGSGSRENYLRLLQGNPWKDGCQQLGQPDVKKATGNEG